MIGGMIDLVGVEFIGVEFAEGGTATVATVYTEDGFAATGEAKRLPGDTDDPDIGRTLALGRALESLAEMMQQYAIAKGFRQQ